MFHRSCLRSARRVSLFAFGVALLAPAAHAQGVLTPPGAPAPTMKSLDQLGTQLTAVEAAKDARIAIETLSGDSSFKYIITTPGSYYLRGNITVSSNSQTAIRINSANVTVDLNGFTVSSLTSTSTVTGISSGAARASVRNGTVTGFANGVALTTHGEIEGVSVADVTGTGLSVSTISGIVRHCRVQNAESVGISGALVHDCTVTNVVGTTGIKFGIDALVVRNCTVSSVSTSAAADATGIRAHIVESCRVNSVGGFGDATGIMAINAGSGVVRDCVVETINAQLIGIGISSETISGCTVRGVAAVGTTTTGILGSSVTDCTVSSIANTGTGSTCTGINSSLVRACEISNVSSTTDDAYGIRGVHIADNYVSAISVGSGTGFGIYAQSNAFVRDNTVTNCRNFGIRVTNLCVVYHNTVSAIGTAASVTDGAHIYSSSPDNRIEANSLNGGAGCDYGIRVLSSRNLIIGNRASSSFVGAATGAGGLDTPEFNIGAANRFGPIATTAASGEITTTNPFANYAD